MLKESVFQKPQIYGKMLDVSFVTEGKKQQKMQYVKEINILNNKIC